MVDIIATDIINRSEYGQGQAHVWLYGMEQPSEVGRVRVELGTHW